MMKSLRILPFTILLAALSVGQVAPINAAGKSEILKSLTETLDNYAYVPGTDFSKVNKFLDDVKPDIEKAATQDDFKDTVNTALHKLGLSHVVLYSPRMLEIRRTQASVGIGVIVSFSNKVLQIGRVMANSPAEEAGLLPGDEIIEVDGKAPESLGSLIGREGDPVKIKIKTYEGKLRTAMLVRRKFVTTRPDTLTWSDDKTAVLTVPTFDLSYDKSRVEKLMKEASRAKSLIVDLRGNPGGIVLNMTHLVGTMIPADKAIGTFITKRVVNEYKEETKGDVNDLVAIAKWNRTKVHPIKFGQVYTGQITVLMNKYSGSAAEMAAAALKETVDATVIGEKSAGQVLVSILGTLPHGFQIQYPITDYITIGGRRLEGTGLLPDIMATDPKVLRPDVKDEPMEKAVALSHWWQHVGERQAG